MAKTEKMMQIAVRVTHEQRETLSRAAALSGVSMTSFLVAQALSDARKVVAKRVRVILTSPAEQEPR